MIGQPRGVDGPDLGRRRGAGFWAALAVGLLVGVANLGKPIHIDDPLYLSIARWIVDHPLDPFGGAINWQEITEPAYKVSISPPGLNYYFALAVRIGGEGPIWLHAAMIPWLVGAAWGLYRLGERWAGAGLPVVLLVLLSPAVLVGTNLMLDVPLLACVVAAVEWLERSLEGRRTRGAVLLAATFGAGAVLIKFAGLALVPIFVVEAWRRRSARPMVAAIGPVVALGAWQLASRSIYGSSQIASGMSFLAAMRSTGGWPIVERVLIMLVILATTFPVWLAASWRGWPPKVAAILALVAGGGAIGAFPRFDWLRPVPSAVAFALAAMLGAFGLIALVGRPAFRGRPDDGADPTQRGPGILLAAWVVSVAGLVIPFGPFVAVRSFLPILPPLAIAVLRRQGPGRLARARLGVLIAATAALGGVLARVDSRWAACYPEVAATLARRYAAPDHPTYVLGHWGWQYYAEQAGFKSWDARQVDLPPGTVVIYPLKVAKQQIHPAVLDRLEVVERITIPPDPFRLTTWDAHARFYGGQYGQFPWSIDAGPTEEFFALRARSRVP